MPNNSRGVDYYPIRNPRLFILFIQHLLSALFTNKYALMRYLINTLQKKAINNFNNNNQF